MASKSLVHFMRRREALSLYRDAMRRMRHVDEGPQRVSGLDGEKEREEGD